MGMKDPEIAQKELEPQLKDLDLEFLSPEYNELEKKVAEKVRKGRERCEQQLMGQVDV